MARILVVDDNAVNRLAMGALLRSLGLECDIVNGGADALDAFRKRLYALVLMDLMMPDMDGYEATRALRAVEFASGRHTPILAVTALDRDAVQAQCVEAGIDDVVCKPVDRMTIAAHVEKWMGLHLEAGTFAPAADAPNVVQSVLHGTEEMKRIVDTFLTVTSTLLSELETAIGAHDDERVRRAVHELKGASLQVRAKEMARLCYELELASRNDDRTEVVAVYAALAHAFARVKEAERKSNAPAPEPSPGD
jgi:two-component system sensor histidine kinase/response regulator